MPQKINMAQKDVFFTYHPAVNFLYFGLVLLFSTFITHPACLLISFTTALCYAIYLDGYKALRLTFIVIFPLMLLTSLLNPIFNHEGATILSYFPDGNPLTLESIACGANSSLMLASVMLWFICGSKIASTDKFIYIFGRIVPSISLLLSMTFRFIPKLTEQFAAVKNAQKCIGRDISSGTLFKRMRCATIIVSIIVTWSLENAIETADSMKSRGYGLKGRTAFSIYRFDKRDFAALIFFCCCGAYIIWGFIINVVHWRFFPTMKGSDIGVNFIILIFCYISLCITPLILNLKEDRKWKHLK